MSSYIKKYSMATIAVSILLIVWAIFLMMNPYESIYYFLLILGAIVVFDGIVHLISYFLTPKESRGINVELFHAIIAILLGIFIMVKPNLLINILSVSIGVWVIIEALLKLKLSINLKRLDVRHWITPLILAIFICILGMIIMLNPMLSITSLFAFIGVILIIAEIINIVDAVVIIYCLRKQ